MKITRFKKTGLPWLFFLLIYCVFLITIVLFFVQLIVATIFYFGDGRFLFSWQNAFTSALSKGTVAGTVLGAGIWIKTKIEEKIRKKAQGET